MCGRYIAGKTICFTLPLVMLALGEETKMPLQAGEGPVGLILGPSRELQRQTYDICNHFCEFLKKSGESCPAMPCRTPTIELSKITWEKKRESENTKS